MKENENKNQKRNKKITKESSSIKQFTPTSQQRVPSSPSVLPLIKKRARIQSVTSSAFPQMRNTIALKRALKTRQRKQVRARITGKTRKEGGQKSRGNDF